MFVVKKKPRWRTDAIFWILHLCHTQTCLLSLANQSRSTQRPLVWKFFVSEHAVACFPRSPSLAITESGACKAFKRMVKRGSVKDLPRSGRPCKIPQKEMREIKLSLVRKKIATAREIQTYLKEVTAPKPVTVSTTTIRNSLKREGFYPYKVVAKPALTAKQKRERVRLAKKWRESIDDWSTVVFSDETTIKEAPRGRNQYQWQRKGTCFADRRKRPKRLFGGKTIRLWAAITHKKVLACHARLENF